MLLTNLSFSMAVSVAPTVTFEEDLFIDMVSAHKYARVMWFAGNGRYVLDYYDEVDMDTPGNSQHNLWSSTGSVFKFVGDAPYQVINGLPQRAQCDSALLRSWAWFPPIAAKDSGFFKPVGVSHEVLGSYCENGTCPWDNNRVKSRTMEVAFPFRRLKSGWVMYAQSSMKTADVFLSWESTCAL